MCVAPPSPTPLCVETYSKGFGGWKGQGPVPGDLGQCRQKPQDLRDVAPAIPMSGEAKAGGWRLSAVNPASTLNKDREDSGNVPGLTAQLPAQSCQVL